MHHSVLVCVLERAGYVVEHRHGGVDGEPPFAAEPSAERFALDVGHRVIGEPVAFSGGEQRHDVGMLESRRQPYFAGEAFGAHPFGELRGEHLHDDAPPEPRLLGHEHARHPPAAQLAPDGVAALQGRL